MGRIVVSANITARRRGGGPGRWGKIATRLAPDLHLLGRRDLGHHFLDALDKIVDLG